VRERDGVLVLGVNELVLTVHEWWAWVVIVGNAIVGVWALLAHKQERFRVPALWWATAAAEVAIFIQVILGVILIQGRKDAKDLYGFHLLYGFSAAFAVAIIYSYRNQLGDKKYLLYGLGGLFIMGLGLRAIATLP
jgi:cytochrome bd-type quinol oxidase subunit 2